MPSIFLGFSGGGGGGGSSFFLGMAYGPTSFPGPPASGGGVADGFCWLFAGGGDGGCCWSWCCALGSGAALRENTEYQSASAITNGNVRICLILRANCQKNMLPPGNTLLV